MEYLIRKIQPDELPVLVQLCAKHADYEEAAYETEGKIALLEAAIFGPNPRLHCYVVECETQIAGYCTFTFDFSTWDARPFLYLDCLYLEPVYRGLRIGEQIFALLRSVAAEHGCVNIQWQTPTFNERAISFYHRMGGVSSDKKRFKLFNII